MNSDKTSLMEFYQDFKDKKIKKGHQAQKTFSSLNGQDLTIPYAFCELCEQSDEKVRATCECLNCNLPLCLKCKNKHQQNPRLQTHKILNYQQMIFSGKSMANNTEHESPTPRGGRKGHSNQSSQSPGQQRQGTIVANNRKTPGQSMSSANSSGKFSVRHALGNTALDQNRDPLELMICPSHEGNLLDHYSINIREFMCKICIKEIEGTQREIDMNAIPVDDAIKILENRLNMQTLVNLDEKIRTLLDLIKKKKDFCLKDKEESLKSINRQFDILYRKLEERKNTLFQKIIAIADQEIESVSAVKERSIQMFQPIQNSSAIGYARSLERIIDFIGDMKDVQLPQKLTNDYNVSISIDELSKQLDKLGSINFQGDLQNGANGGLGSGNMTNNSGDFSLITNDFSKPKAKIQNSKILPEIVQSIKILKVLPHFKDNNLLYRWTKDLQSNDAFHQKCDNQGPILVIIKLDNGGWRKTKQSYIFSITDGKAREPFISQIRSDNPNSKLRSIYFSEKFGLVFGTNDLAINFNNMSLSCSKLGQVYEVPNNMNELCLAGQEKNWIVQEIEIFALSLYK
ncbi:UNKNOWN [Stylonychia lemnae]|uniref:Uncharacterized protein n=1 Tax=Stylonychia lemnae TaxID=5949 RepID=A0A078A757_STYLE|nr:UNKNOWN [Stylonychia lemnae]|eukprot:CDW78080.1 UNKNOWN [Stylonychia lemnae]